MEGGGTLLKYQCEECKIEAEGSQCPICQGRTKVLSQLYWCDTCNVPLYNETCEVCGSEGRLFTTDVRPVFPQERLLIEILLGKPLEFKDKSVWASSGDRYYVDGKKIQFSTNQHCDEDADLVRNEWEKYSEFNNYSEFDSVIEKFVKANRNREAFLEDEAMSYIKKASVGYDSSSMFVSFSGGKDSTVVSDLVMRGLGRSDVLHIFGNTTLEFPQTINYVSAFKKQHPHTPLLSAENKEQNFYKLCEYWHKLCKRQTCARIWFSS